MDRSINRGAQLGIVAGLALLIVAIVVVVVIDSSGDDAGTGAADVTAEVEALYEGIEQDGNVLGDPSAPVSIVEFADPQCPFCAQASADVVPTLVERYVEPGDASIELNLLTFIGADSERAARVAIAAGLQGRMWQFMDIFYREQGPENSGYATDEFLREIAEATPGLDVDKAFEDRGSAQVTELLTEAQQGARRLQVNSTPSFFASRGGGDPEPIQVRALEPAEFTRALDPFVRR